MPRKRITILGSTGSIGRQTLDVIAAHRDRLEVVGLAAHSRTAALADQVRDFAVQRACLVAPEAAAEFVGLLPEVQLFRGTAGLCELVEATQPDIIIGAISGGAGLLPLMEALRQGIDVALANKEPLVMAGGLVTGAAQRSGARLIPVDSELSAILQCLQGEEQRAVEKVILTASGGPFSRLRRDELAAVTPDQALKHPNWQMGAKVTVDSATLANKGFEIYEAKWLFGLDFRQVEVVVHHQSIIHSLVQFTDTSVIAQLGIPDMRVPIQYALFYPERVANRLPRLSLTEVGQLTFAAPDEEKFPCLRLARQAAEAGGGYPAALNGADEVAVASFLKRRIGFPDIPRLIGAALDAYPGGYLHTLDDVLAADAWGREFVQQLVSER